MTLDVHRSAAGTTVLRASGEVDIALTSEQLPTLADRIAGASAVVLDLTDVTFFDSAGCRFVDRLARECASVGAPFRVVAPPRSPSRQVLRIVGMEQGLVCDSVAEGEAAVGAAPAR